MLSVSFDPEHDDPAALADYQRRVGDHGAGWVAARPLNRADLAALMRLFGVVAVPDGRGDSCTTPRSRWSIPTADWSQS